MACVAGVLLMNFHQLAIVVIYFLPQPDSIFKLAFRIINDFLKEDLPSPMAAGTPNPLAAPAIRQFLPVLPVPLIPGSQLAHRLPTNLKTGATCKKSPAGCFPAFLRSLCVFTAIREWACFDKTDSKSGSLC